MSKTTKTFLLIVAVIIGAFFAYNLIMGLVATALRLIVPLLIIGGIGLILYSAINRKSLGASRRYLP
jgi:hypothetical protein